VRRDADMLPRISDLQINAAMPHRERRETFDNVPTMEIGDQHA